MFAVVEFDNNKKEFYVIPLIWLSDDKTNCYWPKGIKSESQLSEMIQNMNPPESTWKLYRLKKVHYTAGILLCFFFCKHLHTFLVFREI